MLLIGNIIAMDFDNVKQFDKPLNSEYGIVTIKNAFGLGKNIEKIELKENTNICGDECYAIKEIELFEYGKLVDSVKFDTIKLDKNGNEINRYEQNIRDYKFYYADSRKEKEIIDYENVCEKIDTKNNSRYLCEYKQIGSHIEFEYEWKEYHYESLLSGIYWLKLEGHKKPDRTIDWIITAQGKEIRDWALWTGQVSNTLLTNYYTFNQTTGTNVVDVVRGLNGTSSADMSSLTATGKIGPAINTTDGDVDLVTYKADILSNQNGSLSFWFRWDSSAVNNQIILGKIVPGNYEVYVIRLKSPQMQLQFDMDDGGGDLKQITIDGITTNKWYYVVHTWNGTGWQVFIDGQLNSTAAYTKIPSSGGTLFKIGYSDGTEARFRGLIDEMSFWNRTLTSTEVSNLYNTGSGVTYPLNFNQLVLNSPSNNSVLKSPISFNASFSSHASNAVNMSLFINGVINTTNLVSGTTNSTIFNLNMSSGTYLWNVQACDSDGDCSFANNNFTLNVDNVPPSITITYPTAVVNYHQKSTNLSLNWTLSEYSGSCWHNYTGVNTFVNCNLNSTQLNITDYNKRSLTFFTNDSSGNLNQTNVNWNYTIFENSLTYSTTTQEYDSESFSSEIIIPSANSVSANLIYNNTYYVADVSQAGTIYTLSKTIEIPGGTSSNVFKFEVIINGTYYQNLSQHTQSVSSIILTEKNTTYPLTTLIFNTKDEANGTLINSTMSWNINYYPQGSSGTTAKTFSSTNSTSTTTKYLSIFPNESAFILNGFLTYSSSGYDTRNYYFINFVANNQSQTIDLFSALTADTDVVSFTVVDDTYNPVEGAIIVIEKLNVGNDSYEHVNSVVTDTEGKAASNLYLYSTYYRYKIYYNGVLYLTRGPSQQTTTTTQFQIFFESSPDYSLFYDISHSLSFNRTTNVTAFFYNTTTVNITQGCLVIKNNTVNQEQVYSNCVSSSSSSISVVVNTPGNYIAYGIIEINSNDGLISKVVDTLFFSNVKQAKYEIINTFGRFISIIMIAVAAFIGVAAGSIILGIGLIVLVLFIINWIGLLDLTNSLFVILSILLLIVIIAIRRRK